MLNKIMEKGNKYVLAADKTNLSAVNLYKKLGFIPKAENMMKFYLLKIHKN